jgi:sugar-specific transcriptional regulator TrmB
MSITQTLTNLGFSANEAKVYLAALEMGVSSAQEIAKKAKLKRTTAYSILQNLANRGVVIVSKEKGKNRFVAENPQNIVKQFAEYQKNLEKALPQLEAIYNKKEIKPKVLFFEGKEGIKKIYLDTIKEKPKIILEFNTTEIFKTFPGFPMEYLGMRKTNNIRAKRIASGIRWQEHAKKDKEEISETKILPREEFDIPIEINIYNNKVAFMSYSDEFGLIIESEGIAKSMKAIYDLFWKKLK